MILAFLLSSCLLLITLLIWQFMSLANLVTARLDYSLKKQLFVVAPTASSLILPLKHDNIYPIDYIKLLELLI
jgi:hypothetical protein